MDRKFIVILIVVVLALAGLFVYSSRDKSENAETSQTNGASVSNHSRGENSKNVELLVYGDFECSACAQLFPIEKAVFEKYQNDIKFTFRHFPLPDTIHPNARAAHRAAEAAGLQGKFFEMHDLLYENQSQWSGSSKPKQFFDRYAQSIGLNMDQFNKDYASESVNSTINADKNEGKSKNIAGTPTFFINGEQISNSQLNSVEAFSAQIEQAIQKQKSN